MRVIGSAKMKGPSCNAMIVVGSKVNVYYVAGEHYVGWCRLSVEGT